MTSCTPSLDSIVERMREQLPMEMSDGMKMKDIVIKNDFLQYEMEYDEHDLRMDESMMEPILELMRDQIKEQFISNVKDDDVQALFELCIQEDKGVRFVMEGTESKRNLTLLEMDSEELKLELGK